MALLLIGATASGKDTIAKILIDRYGMKKHVTYTTRPARPGEVDGIDYHFITDVHFQLMKDMEFFDEWTSYRVATGEIWCYGSSKDGVTDDTIMIVNPDGWKKYCGLGTTFYLTCDKEERIRRLELRGDNPDEAKRRMMKDEKDFRYFDAYSDYTINTTDLKPEDIAEKIYSIYKEKTDAKTDLFGRINDSI